MSKKNRWDIVGICAVVFSVAFCLLLTAKICGGGVLSSGDSAWHYSNEAHLLRSVESGQGVFSCFAKGLGHPLANFYQPLLYLLVVVMHLLSFKLVGLIAVHNFLVCVLFALFPLAMWYLARSFRATRFQAGCVSVFALFPISGWGHSLDAYFWIGLHTQLIGAVCLPVFLGAVHRLTWHRNRWKQCRVLVLALTAVILGHAVFALLAAFALAVYLGLFFILRGVASFKRLLISLTCCLGTVFMLCAFWIVPFIISNHTYKFIPESERSFSPLAVSVTPAQLICAFAGGDLFDTTTVSSPLFGGGEEGFRWSMNDAFKRFHIFTLLILFGLICAIVSRRKLSQLYFAALFVCAALLFCGKDDVPILHFLPFSRNFQPIRAVYLLELSGIMLAGTSFAWLVQKVWNTKKITNAVFRYGLAAALCGVLCIPLYERFRIASMMVHADNSPQTAELQSLCKKIQTIQPGKRIFYGKSTGMKDITIRALADYYFLNNVCGHDNAMGGSMAWLANEIQDRLPYSPAALSLFNVDSLITDKSWNSQRQNSGVDNPYLEEKFSGNYFSVQHIKSDSDFFFAYPKKPVMVWCDTNTWYYLNREWLSLFLVHGFKLAPLIKAPENFDRFLSADNISSFMALDLSLPNDKQQQYVDALRRFKQQGGIIASNRPLGIPDIEKITPGNRTIFQEFLMGPQPYSEPIKIVHEKNMWYRHDIQIETNQPRFITAKTAYYAQWQAADADKQYQTFWMSPGFVGLLAMPGTRHIQIQYRSSFLHRLFFFVALAGVVMLIVLRKKIRGVLNRNTGKIRYYHCRGAKFYRTVIKGITLAGSVWLAMLASHVLIMHKTSLIYPYHNLKGCNPYEIVFRWNKLNETARYDFQLSDSKSFAHIIFQVDDVTDNHLGYRGLKPYTRYYWRVRAGNGGWSAARRFRTGNYFPIAMQ